MTLRRRVPMLVCMLLGTALLLDYAVSRPASTSKISQLQSSTLVSGVTLVQEIAQPGRIRWRFEVCGPDVTRFPGPGFPLALAFDTPIGQGTVSAARRSLTSSTQITGRVMSIFLERNPFTPPEPWHLVVVIDFAQAPTTGRLTVGLFEADLTTGLQAAAGQSTVVFGNRCDGAYALQKSLKAAQYE